MRGGLNGIFSQLGNRRGDDFLDWLWLAILQWREGLALFHWVGLLQFSHPVERMGSVGSASLLHCRQHSPLAFVEVPCTASSVRAKGFQRIWWQLGPRYRQKRCRIAISTAAARMRPIFNGIGD